MVSNNKEMDKAKGVGPIVKGVADNMSPEEANDEVSGQTLVTIPVPQGLTISEIFLPDGSSLTSIIAPNSEGCPEYDIVTRAKTSSRRKRYLSCLRRTWANRTLRECWRTHEKRHRRHSSRSDR